MTNIIIPAGRAKDYKSALIEAVSTLNESQAEAFAAAFLSVTQLIATKDVAEAGTGPGFMDSERVLDSIKANGATAEQGMKADGAAQRTELGSSAFENKEYFATAEQGMKADGAVQVTDVALVATTGNYGDLLGKPALGTAAYKDIGEFATAEQGGKADNSINKNKIGAANGIAPLNANGKVDSKFLPVDGAYQGTWNAATNSPIITSGSGVNNQYYIVAIAGSTEIDGNSTWNIGDRVIFNGETWDRIPSVQAVTSVNGQIGAVDLAISDISGAGTAAAYSHTAFASSAQGLKADNALPAASYNAADILAKIKTVDGVGSGLDADLLAGQTATYYLNLANASGVLPNANLSGFYDGITLDSTKVTIQSGVWSTTVPLTTGLIVEGATPNIRFNQTDGGIGAIIGTNSTTFYILADDNSTGIYNRQALSVSLLSTTTSMSVNGYSVFTTGTTGGAYTCTSLYASDYLRVGSDGQIIFGSGTSFNDALYYADSDNIFNFYADGLTEKAIVNAGTFTGSGGLGLPSWTPSRDSTGFTIRSTSETNGYIAVTSSAESAAYFKRLNNGQIVTFRQTGSTAVGGINITSSSTAYATSSDIRKKYDFQPLNPALLDLVKVYNFAFKVDDSRGHGVIAQEIQAIPELAHYVSVGDEEEKFLSVDYSNFVPLLIENVQQLKATVATMQQRITELEELVTQ